MPAEYLAINQIVPAGGTVLFQQAPAPCRAGLIYHREGSGLFRLAGPNALGVRCRRSCCCRDFPEARYQVAFHGNIAVPGDPAGTVEEISLALAVDGEVEPISMRFTPAAVDEYGNVGTDIIVDVPCVCRCSTVAVRNTSTQPINVEGTLVLDFDGVVS